MAPFNLENNIREKLESRELKPSGDAWKKLESQLDKKQPKRKTVWWYYAAASFIGILILSSIFFNQHNFEQNQKLVDEKANENNVQKKSEIIPKPSYKERIVFEDIDEEIGAEKKESKNDTKSIPPKESEVDRQVSKGEVVAEVSENVPDGLPEEAIIKIENQLLDEKANEVVAHIKSLQNSNSEVAMEEVEVLLNNARRDIQARKILQAPKADAMALLEEVEWELDKSFRDKVFDALGEGFQKLRTAISMRSD